MKHASLCDFQPIALATVLALTLTACGSGNVGSSASSDNGGGGDAGGGVTRSVARSGQVYTHQLESHALVCVDVQGAGACSANAATAIRTGADGSFQISVQAADEAAAQQFLAAPLVAEVDDGYGRLTLTAPGVAPQINPLTTLVQRHMQRTGAELADAEQAVAQQLGIERGQIYQYQQQASAPSDNARTAANLTRLGLHLGAPLRTHAPGDVDDSGARLTSLNFLDEGNFDFYLYGTHGAADSASQWKWNATYGGRISGADRSVDNAGLAYEIRSTAGYSGRAEYLRSRGNPARVQIPLHNQFTQGKWAALTAGLKSDAALFEMVIEEIDISNRPMGEVVREMQDYEKASLLPIQYSLFTLDATALDQGAFPAGSRLYRTLRTRFAPTPAPAATPGSSIESTSYARYPNDLPDPAAVLGGFEQPVRLQQSINGPAWEGLRAQLKLAEKPTEESHVN
ncbi:hypothetical protein [Comamonas antarctica]|uniref:hypothetical protein n=1 Tax=Comamonas antarctica TaxID=2743470 RepID=UPI0028E464E7|nr:hypothetical protein [Comamonas antarctica]